MDNSCLYHNSTYTFTSGALITNLGVNSQAGITVTCEIFEVGNPTAIYSETSSTFDLSGVTIDINTGIPSADKNWVLFSNNFTSTENNKDYEFVYTVNAPNSDATSEDNTVQSFFGISDSKYSHAQIDPNTGKAFATGGAGPVTDGSGAITDYWEICTHFSTSSFYGAGALGTFFQAYTFNPIDPNTTLLSKTINCMVYEWVNTGNIYDLTNPSFSSDPDTNQFIVLSQTPYYYQGDYQDSVIYVQYSNPFYMQPNKHYLFCTRVNTNGDPSTLNGIKFRIDSKTDYTTTAGANWDAINSTGIPSSTNGSPVTTVREDGVFFIEGYGFNKPSNAIIHFDCSVGVNDIENNRGLVAYPNPAVDMITLPFGNATGTATINIYDVAGKLVSTQVVNLTGNVNVNVSELENGMYNFNVIYADGSSQDLKVVVTK